MNHFRWTPGTRAIKDQSSVSQASKATWSQASSVDWVTSSLKSQSYRSANGRESTSRCSRRWRKRTKLQKYASTTKKTGFTSLLRCQNSARWTMLRFWRLLVSKPQCQQKIWCSSPSTARSIGTHPRPTFLKSSSHRESSYMRCGRSSC